MNYMNYLIGEPITPYDRNSIKSINIREKQYRKANKDKGIGKSTKGLTKVPKELRDMSVWD